MTYGQDERPDQYPRQGYGQEYRPEDQSWQPPYDPRQHQRPASGPQEAPWQQSPYPPQGYPPGDQWPPQQTQQDHGQFQPPHHHRRKRSRAPLFAGIGAVIVIAGGGTAYALAGHGSSPSPASSSNPAKLAATAKPATLSQLKKVVLQSAELPAGWKGTPHQADPNEAAEDATLYECLGQRSTYGDQVAEADSDDFALGNATISSSATSYRSQSDVNTDLVMLRSPKLPTCFGQSITKELAGSLPAGTTVKSTSLSITLASAGSPANISATGTAIIKVEVSGQEVPIYMTIAFITGPLIEGEVDAVNGNTPVPASVVKPLAAAMAARAGKA